MALKKVAQAIDVCTGATMIFACCWMFTIGAGLIIQMNVMQGVHLVLILFALSMVAFCVLMSSLLVSDVYKFFQIVDYSQGSKRYRPLPPWVSGCLVNTLPLLLGVMASPSICGYTALVSGIVLVCCVAINLISRVAAKV
jgi:hypothetical protein